MNIAIHPLTTLDDLRACELLQRSLLGERAKAALPVPTLAAIKDSGGLLLGAWEGQTMVGAIVDLVAAKPVPRARFTCVHAVAEDARNKGIGALLRMRERAIALEGRTDLIWWWMDPLRSDQSHLAFNKLGAIGSGYLRNALGPLTDRLNSGLATDRIRIEWWIGSPRVRGVTDEGRTLPHFSIAFHQMEVLTKTKGLPSGSRALIGFGDSPTCRYVLTEIPVDLDRLRKEGMEAARGWRLGLRELYPLLFSHGYTIVGLVHEGGRSFHLFEQRPIEETLGRDRPSEKEGSCDAKNWPR